MHLSPRLQAVAQDAGARARDLHTASDLLAVLPAAYPEVRRHGATVRKLIADAYSTDVAKAGELLTAARRATNGAAREHAATAVVLSMIPWTRSGWPEEINGPHRESDASVLAQEALPLLGSPASLEAALWAEIDERHLEATGAASELLLPVLDCVRLHPTPQARLLPLAVGLEELAGTSLESPIAGESLTDEQAQAETTALQREIDDVLIDAPARARLTFSVLSRRGESVESSVVATSMALRELTAGDEPEHFVAYCPVLVERVATRTRDLRSGVDPHARRGPLTAAEECIDEGRPTWFLLDTLVELLALHAADRFDREVAAGVRALFGLLGERHPAAVTTAVISWQSAAPAVGYDPYWTVLHLQTAWEKQMKAEAAARVKATGDARLQRAVDVATRVSPYVGTHRRRAASTNDACNNPSPATGHQSR